MCEQLEELLCSRICRADTCLQLLPLAVDQKWTSVRQRCEVVALQEFMELELSGLARLPKDLLLPLLRSDHLHVRMSFFRDCQLCASV